MSDPQSRNEAILRATIDGTEYTDPPQSRMEDLLIELKETIESGGGGGGGGTTNYNLLNNKPKVAGVELTGNKSLADLGIQPELTFDNVPKSGSANPVKSGGVYTQLANKVDKAAGKGLSTNDLTNELLTKLNGIEAGAQVNIIEKIMVNGAEVVPVNKAVALTLLTTSVNNLANYYLKSETYTQEEVNALINGISSLTMEIVETLPTTDISTTTIYLVETSTANVYMQYAYINSSWAQLGTTQVDLSNYYTKTQVDAALALKQDAITFDSAPVSGSDNPVKSGGLYNALAGKQDTLTFDSTPTENSTNPVESGGVYDALEGKQDTLTFDSAPTLGSTNPVTSGGVATALQNVSVDVATTQQTGVVKPDGTSVTIDQDGTIHAAAGVDFDEQDFAVENQLVSLQSSQRIFTGTTAEWEALSTAVKKTYGQVNITDDESATDTKDDDDAYVTIGVATGVSAMVQVMRKKGIVNFVIGGTTQDFTVTNSATTICTLPEEYRPLIPIETYVTGRIIANQANDTPILLRITTAGVVTIVHYGTGSRSINTMNAHATYMVKEG